MDTYAVMCVHFVTGGALLLGCAVSEVIARVLVNMHGHCALTIPFHNLSVVTRGSAFSPPLIVDIASL